MDQIKYWIETEGVGHCFFMVFPVALLSLLIWFKGRRVRFVIPCIMISIVIINPFFYQIWDSLNLYAYWRLLWVVPVIPIIATVVPSITERIKKLWIRAIVVAAGMSLIVYGGTYLYNGTGGSFVEASNVAKIPEDVAAIADRLLEFDDRPKVVFQYPLGVYIRQYTGEIDQLYGRDVDGYILSWGVTDEARNIYDQVCNFDGDLDIVSQYMLDNDYAFLVLRDVSREENLKSGFEYMDRVGEYGIYTPIGKPTIVKNKDELGKVVSATYVNEKGQPTVGENGYVTTLYEYNKYGDVIREYHIDAYGVGVENENGSAGVEREVDYYGHLIMERQIDKEGKSTKAGGLYAEIRWEYQGNNLIAYSYYDENGRPVNNSLGFSRAERIFDKNGNIVDEFYYDAEGKQIDDKW